MNSLTAVQEVLQENGNHREARTEPAGKHNFAQDDNGMNVITPSVATDSDLRQDECTRKKYGSQEDVTVNKSAHRKTSPLGRLRRSFEQHVKSKDQSAKRCQKPQNKRFRRKSPNDRVIQRSKTYNGPFWEKKSHKEKLSRSKSYGDREPSSRFPQKHVDSSDRQTELQTVQAAMVTFSYTEREPREVSNENKDVANEGVHKCEEYKERESCVSLFNIIQDSQFELIAVKLERAPEDKWGIELIQVDKEASSMCENDSKRNGPITVNEVKKPAGNTIAVEREASASSSANHHSSQLVAGLRDAFRRRIKKKNDGMMVPLSSTVKEENFQPRHGVRILGLTEEGVAGRNGKLAVEDLIIEVNGRIVLDSSPEQVVAAIEKSLTAEMVVSRAIHPKQN